MLCPKLLYFFEKMRKVFKNKAQGCSTPLTYSFAISLIQIHDWNQNDFFKISIRSDSVKVNVKLKFKRSANILHDHLL